MHGSNNQYAIILFYQQSEGNSPLGIPAYSWEDAIILKYILNK
jgi:hypothetical protein